jgi:flagellar M-ring protein FliF
MAALTRAAPEPAPIEAQAGGQALLASSAPNFIDVAQVQGQVHAQSVHRVGELAERNPTETAAIVRQWLGESSE